MSLFHYFFDNDWWQRADIEQLRSNSERLTSALDRSRDKTHQSEKRVAELEEEVAQFALFGQTMLRMLIEKEVCTKDEFSNLFQMIDLEDGVADGKLTVQRPEAVQGICPDCGRRFPKNKTWCMYCGKREGSNNARPTEDTK